ncbi:MAG: helix-turn-helix transcriptional regulator [Blastocatellia bacterium]
MSRTSGKNIRSSFGESVKIFREQKGLSQEKLAELAGIDRTYVSTIELGKKNTSIEIAYRIAQALDMPLSVIIKRAER